jgi:3-oxoacyl-[acyl-carrier protein] reductase
MIYCAGINNPCQYKYLSEENIQQTMQTNLFSFINLCQQVNFNAGANIIAIGSLYATETRAERLAYTVSKHGMYGAVKTLAIEMAQNKIKVNMISPGFVLTEMTKQNNTEDRISYLQNKIPLGMTLPEDIANMCYHLLFNESITGQNIIIDGGYSLIGI